MMWTAIGCLIGGLILLIWMLIWNSTSQKDPASRASYTRWQGLMQVAYLALFMASAVLFLIW